MVSLLVVIYLSFIGLGLPDSLLGAAWPSVYPAFGVPISYAGILSTIVAVGTILSSLLSDRLTRRFGAGRVTLFSVSLTALALYGFSASRSFGMLCLWAVPYGLGAGSVDAALNNYVALHYASRHMSWLHCMWGVGASIGPAILGLALSGNAGWSRGYLYVALLQSALVLVLLLSQPQWKKTAAGPADAGPAAPARALSLREIFRMPGAKEVMLTFFCYCALEQTAGLWASSYLTVFRGFSGEAAAGLASLFFAGITVGRGVNGFLTMRWSDTRLVRMGCLLTAAGVLALALLPGRLPALAGLVLIGLGCAPIYPCILHATPAHFGAERSQAIVGVQMASAYLGTCVMPPLFGLLAGRIGIGLLPAFLALNLVLMALMHERLLKTCRT